MLARFPLRAEIWARARCQELRAAHPHPHPVFRGPTHPGNDLASPGCHQGDSTLDEVGLAPRTDRIAEIAHDFLGDPHHFFPLGVNSTIAVASALWLAALRIPSPSRGQLPQPNCRTGQDRPEPVSEHVRLTLSGTAHGGVSR